MTYYFLQNSDDLRKVIHQDKSVPPNLAMVLDRIMTSYGSYDAEAMEGGNINLDKKKDDNHGDSMMGNGDSDLDGTQLRRRKKALTQEERERREKFNKSLLDLDTE